VPDWPVLKAEAERAEAIMVRVQDHGGRRAATR